MKSRRIRIVPPRRQFAVGRSLDDLIGNLRADFAGLLHVVSPGVRADENDVLSGVLDKRLRAALTFRRLDLGVSQCFNMGVGCQGLTEKALQLRLKHDLRAIAPATPDRITD